jgi:regulatory protein NPR1
MCYFFILSEVVFSVFTQLFSCYVVALARIMFPIEARVAMDIAQVDGTLEFNLGSGANPRPEIQGGTVDLNETPFIMKDEHLARIRALSKTGEAQLAFV